MVFSSHAGVFNCLDKIELGFRVKIVSENGHEFLTCSGVLLFFGGVWCVAGLLLFSFFLFYHLPMISLECLPPVNGGITYVGLLPLPETIFKWHERDIIDKNGPKSTACLPAGHGMPGTHLSITMLSNTAPCHLQAWRRYLTTLLSFAWVKINTFHC